MPAPDPPIDATAIRGFRCFETLSEADAGPAARRLTVTRFPVGETLFRQGDEGTCVYLLVEGRVDIRADAPGEEDQSLATLTPGAVLGEVSVLISAPRSATAIAETDVTLWELSRADLDAALAAGERWATAFLLGAARDLANRMTLVNRQLIHLLGEAKQDRAATPPARVAELEQLRTRLLDQWSF